MKSILYLLGGVAAVAAYLLIAQGAQGTATVARFAEPVEQLAHKLQDAWVDHHTVA